MPHGYDVELLEEPYYVSRGEWTLTGTESVRAYELLKRSTTITSGLWGSSGVYYTRNQATMYDDISGISGCIGASLSLVKKDSDTGMTNITQPMFRRQLDVVHFGVIKLAYVSGTLDGSVVTLKWGDLLAPSISGFRVYQEINTILVTGEGDSEVVLNTGTRQQVLATYMDTPSAITGTTGYARKKVFIHPQAIYGVHK